MSIAISVAALVFSLAAFQYGRWRDKRDLLLKIHEHLVSADQHRGRRLLYEMKETQTRVEDIREEDYLLINNALAALNVLGIYYRRRYVRRKDVLELWAIPVLRAVLAGEAVMARRDTENGTPIWPHLRSLAEDARTYTKHAGITVQAPGAPPTELYPSPITGVWRAARMMPDEVMPGSVSGWRARPSWPEPRAVEAWKSKVWPQVKAPLATW